MKKGDYVLATKYSDGDPNDQWCIGFYDREENNRHFVEDGEGIQFRSNGFRRVEKVSGKQGEFILQHQHYVENGDWSLWWWKRRAMMD